MPSQSPALSHSHWPADDSQPLLNLTTGDALRQTAEQVPEREALVEKVPAGWPSLVGADSTSRRWTYRQLLDDATHCAHWLLERFEPGQRICVWAPNVPEWVILQYGAALAGLVLVTANPALQLEELRYVLEKSRAAALFHVDSFRGTDMAGCATQASGGVLPCFSFTGWLGQVRACKAVVALPSVQPRDPVQIQYTSGTTGRPKGALLHHMGLVTNGYYVALRAQISDDIFVCSMPLFHTAGSVMSVLGCLTTRSTLVLALLFEPDLILSAIEAERATKAGGVPTMLLALMEQLKKKTYDISSLDLMESGGAPVPVALGQRVRHELGADLVTVYGQTELSPVVCQTALDDSAEDKAQTAGRPLWNAEVRIADLHSSEPVALGEEGEIQVRGYQTMLEYFDDPEATEKTLLADGWLRTGDLGTMDQRGFLKVTGRLKDMIIRGGENIYPAEVEAVLMNHEAVEDVSVFGVADDHWGETVAAAIRFKSDVARPSAETLKAYCRQHLAPHKAPSAWFACDVFPLTGSGKVQKFRLKEQVSENGLEQF